MGIASSRSVNDWENPAVFGINKRSPHVTLRSFTSKDQVFEHYRLLSEQATSPRRLSLNSDTGQWKFKLVDRPKDVPDSFWQPEYDTSQWDEVGLFSFFVSFEYSTDTPHPHPHQTTTTDHCTYKLGVPGLRKTSIHQFCLSIPNRLPSLCARCQSHRMLPTHIYPTTTR